MDFLANPDLFDPLIKLFSYLAIVGILPFLFIIYLVLTESAHRQQIIATFLFKINHYLRMFWYMLSLVMFPYAFICWFAGIIVKNITFYNLNLIVIGLYFPIVLLVCYFSRRLELRNKSIISFFLVLLPVLVLATSLVSLTKM